MFLRITDDDDADFLVRFGVIDDDDVVQLGESVVLKSDTTSALLNR